MKKYIRCRCCGDKTSDISSRFDAHHGTVCQECYDVMNGHLGLWAMGLIEGAVYPEPIREKEEAP